MIRQAVQRILPNKFFGHPFFDNLHLKPGNVLVIQLPTPKLVDGKIILPTFPQIINKSPHKSKFKYSRRSLLFGITTPIDSSWTAWSSEGLTYCPELINVFAYDDNCSNRSIVKFFIKYPTCWIVEANNQFSVR